MDPQLPLPTPSSIYVAGPISAKDDVKALVQAIRDLKVVNIVSRWHDLPDEQTSADPENTDARRVANDVNMADIDRSDIVVAWTLTGRPCTTYCEIGYALGIKKRVLWVQGPDHIGANIFDSHPLSTRLTHLRTPLGDVAIAHPKTAAWAVWRYLMDEVDRQCGEEHPTGVPCQRPNGHHDGIYHDDHIGHGWRWSVGVLRSIAEPGHGDLYPPGTPHSKTWTHGQFAEQTARYAGALEFLGVRIYGGLL